MNLAFWRTKARTANGVSAKMAGHAPSWAQPWSGGGVGRGDGAPRSYEAQVRASYLKNPVAARAVRLLSEGAGGAPLVSNPSGHPALALLHSCGCGASGPGLMETLTAQLLLHGNAYVEVATGADGLPAALYALRPERVTVALDAKGWPEAYLYRAGDTVTRYAPENRGEDAGLLHIRGFHPLDDHYGLGCLGAAEAAVTMHNAASQWNRALLDNAARPSGAVVYQPGDGSALSAEQFERLKAEMEAGFSGTGNAGRPMLLEGGLSWQAMSLTPAEMDFAKASAQARTDTQGRARDRQTYGGDRGPDIVEMGFYDVTRDYQPGLQRVRRGHGSRLRQGVLPAAMTPAAAKSLAARLLSRGQASRLTRALSLPWRDLGVTPGMLVRLEGAAEVWRVRELRFENFVMGLSLERLTASTGRAVRADGGRALQFADVASGATTLQFFELPGLGGGVPAVPSLYVAGAGASASWRRAGFELSADNGASYASAGMVTTPTVMGATVEALRAGTTTMWDQHNHIDVVLLGSHMWLESKGDLAVLQGANLALVGDELVQFGQAEALGPGHFRLTRLLRGRRGTEWAAAEHSAGERFVLLDTPGPVAVEAAVGMIGQTLQARPTGAFDAGVASQALVVKGASLQPLAPVHVRMRQEGGDFVITWTRRSRGGFVWLDFVDAPLSEVREAYRLRILLDDVVVREQEVTETQFRYDFSDRLADGGGGTVGVEIAQLSAVAGPGRAASTMLVVN